MPHITQWSIFPHEDYYLPLKLVGKNPKNKELLQLIHDGPPQSLMDRWATPKVAFVADTEEQDEWGYTLRKRDGDSDCPGLEGLLACSLQAIEFLQPLFNGWVEMLPLECDEGDYRLLNILSGIDYVKCLEAKIPPEYDPVSGVITKRETFIYKKGCIEDKHIFRLRWKSGSWSDTYISETLKQAIETSGFTGFQFY